MRINPTSVITQASNVTQQKNHRTSINEITVWKTVLRLLTIQSLINFTFPNDVSRTFKFSIANFIQQRIKIWKKTPSDPYLNSRKTRLELDHANFSRTNDDLAQTHAQTRTNAVVQRSFFVRRLMVLPVFGTARYYNGELWTWRHSIPSARRFSNDNSLTLEKFYRYRYSKRWTTIQRTYTTLDEAHGSID